MIDKLDTPGGHIAVCLFIMLLFVGLRCAGYAWAGDLAAGSQSAVYLAIQIRKGS